MESLKADILNWKKEKVGELELPVAVFKQELKPHLISEVVRWQRALARQGTSQAKTRSGVRGGGKKPFRQKGTGNARQGSIRSPLNRGGGVTFGPKPRSYSYALPAQVKKSGLKQALSFLFKDNKIFIMEDMKSPEGKTKELYTRLQNLALTKALLVCHKEDILFKRACANLKSFQFLPLAGLNVYDLLKYGHLLLSKAGAEAFIKQANQTKVEDESKNSSIKQANQTKVEDESKNSSIKQANQTKVEDESKNSS